MPTWSSGALPGLFFSTAPALLAPLQNHIKAVLQNKVKDLPPDPAEGGRRSPPGVANEPGITGTGEVGC